ncbi:arylsulfatase [Thozetella sp. PMI_491]|nr:arylsulfatase [Thozetella sp. PMI_491]
MKSTVALLLTLGLQYASCSASSATASQKPNIVFIFTDDQDLHLGSIHHQERLLSLMRDKGTFFSNHYATVSQCCPSRASLLRGQAAHNTNITNVDAPGGNYDKWTLAGEDKDYLPHWLKKAGYHTEYMGKLMNGYSIFNYDRPAPRGWDHADILLDPYQYEYNRPVMSENGARPVTFPGYHQIDVLKAKALARLDYMAALNQPFYLTIAPTAPHDQDQLNLPPIPLARYYDDFPETTLVRVANFNPADQTLQSKKASWWGQLPLLNQTQLDTGDLHFRRRLQALKGVDDIVEDVIGSLDAKGVLNNTYVIYTSDNGFHIATHRDLGGKTSPYREDTNLPFFVRGPGIPANVTSGLPSAHLDLAPTFLEIAGLAKEEWPAFLDGRSLLDQWHNPTKKASKCAGDTKEIINVEYWGGSRQEAPGWTFIEGSRSNNSYKTLRIVTEGASWLYSKWCTNQTELFNTTADPWELNNLADSSDPQIHRVLTRLNAILLGSKSCETDSCRDLWKHIQPGDGTVISSLAQALDQKYDSFFNSFPTVAFQECMTYQATWNEMPFWPPESISLGSQFRGPTDNYESKNVRGLLFVPNNTVPAGGWDQRYVTLDTIMKTARYLTDYELNTTSTTSS